MKLSLSKKSSHHDFVNLHNTGLTDRKSSLNLFGKIFEEAGPLGKGITVGKVQVSLSTLDRSTSTSIFGILESRARNADNSPEGLSKLTNEVCLALLRRSDEWTAACSDSQWFGQDDGGKAESLFNDWSNIEAAKFEKEYIPAPGTDESSSGATNIVVSIVVEIQGDTTKFEGAGFSLSGTKEILSSIAANCLVDEGYCLNAAEVFWTPSDRNEILSSTDLIVDFPELITL